MDLHIELVKNEHNPESLKEFTVQLIKYHLDVDAITINALFEGNTSTLIISSVPPNCRALPVWIRYRQPVIDSDRSLSLGRNV